MHECYNFANNMCVCGCTYSMLCMKKGEFGHGRKGNWHDCLRVERYDECRNCKGYVLSGDRELEMQQVDEVDGFCHWRRGAFSWLGDISE